MSSYETLRSHHRFHAGSKVVLAYMGSAPIPGNPVLETERNAPRNHPHHDAGYFPPAGEITSFSGMPGTVSGSRIAVKIKAKAHPAKR